MSFSKSKWTPFAGTKVRGSVHRVVLRGEIAYVEGKVLVNPGFGQDIREIHRNTRSQPIINLPTVDVVSSRQNNTLDRLLSPNYEKPHVNADYSNEESREIVSYLHPSVDPESTSILHLSTNHGLAGHHILTADMFTKEQSNVILDVAQRLRAHVLKNRPLDHILRGKIVALIFYEVSTRTSCSFSAAMQRLGGRVIQMDGSTSSVKKGETLEDSVAIMAGYADAVVLRHPEPGAVARAARNCLKPMINAGDGVGEHPTQALLDVFTIRQEIGTVNGLTITMVGDLKHGRTVHSLARSIYTCSLIIISFIFLISTWH